MAATDARNYVCVFYADPAIEDDVVDLGLDPDFSAPLPTWGICRPNLRCSVGRGSRLVFVGYYRETRTYILKGWFEVDDVIGYEQALELFANRRNVIIRYSARTQPRLPTVWKRKGLRALVEPRWGSKPDFLTSVRGTQGLLVQNPDDDHEIDNWKCQRMFGCDRDQFLSCNEAGECLREADFGNLRGYVVAKSDRFDDFGSKRLLWIDVAPARLKGVSLRTPVNQHNPRRLSSREVDDIIRAAGTPPGFRYGAGRSGSDGY